MTRLAAVVAVWAALSIPAGLAVGRFIRAGRGPTPTTPTREGDPLT